MKIWHLEFELDKFTSMTIVDDDDWSNLTFDGTTKVMKWIPIDVKIIGHKKIANATSLSPGIPVFDTKTMQILHDLIYDSTEALELKCSKGKFFAINICEILDCVDYNKSIYEKYYNSDRIMVFDKYEFKEECLKNKHIFKIVDEIERTPFVSEEFRKRVLENNLTGFKFKLVWDSLK